MKQESGNVRTGDAKGKANEATEFTTEIPNSVRVQGGQALLWAQSRRHNPPPCTSNIFKNRGALSNQKETVCKEQREAEENIQKTNPWASLMVQWFQVQEARVLFLVKELDCTHCN